MFIEFIDELENKWDEKYGEWRKTFILTWVEQNTTPQQPLETKLTS